jgi:hypothetical protein
MSAPVTKSSIAALGDTIVAFSSRRLFVASADQGP